MDGAERCDAMNRGISVLSVPVGCRQFEVMVADVQAIARTCAVGMASRLGLRSRRRRAIAYRQPTQLVYLDQWYTGPGAV
jgi:hypothetical protein